MTLLIDVLSLLYLLILILIAVAILLLWIYAFFRVLVRLRKKLESRASLIARLDRLTANLHWFIKLAILCLVLLALAGHLLPGA